MLDQLKISRRFALRGALCGVGVSLWLPVLDVMCNDHGTAFAQGGALPTSFGVFYWGNGIHHNYWVPDTVGSGDAWQLSSHLEAFAGVKDYLTLVSGTQMLDGVFKGHGWGVCYVLAGGDSYHADVTSDIDSHPVSFETDESTQFDPTVDQIVADAIGQDTPFASIETGILPYKGLNMGTVSLAIAHRGPYDYLPPERDPAKLFDRLFGNIPGGSPPPGDGPTPSDITNQLRRSVLDAVLEDAKRLDQQLGAADSMRLERHMESIRAIEQRIPSPGDNPPPASCQVPADPGTIEELTERSQTLNRLIATALSCNLTRVYSHLWSGARDDNTYPVVGVNADHHGQTHGNDAAQEQAATIEKYIFDQYADLATVMRDTPIGAGNLLDQTLIYGITEVSNPKNHVHVDYPITLMGRAGGMLRGNLHHQAQGQKVTEVVLTLMQVMGVDIDNWGTWDNTSSIMSEILA